MWHLILPPIVVVFCFVFIVWFLSLRGSDPIVAQKALSVAVPETGFFRRILRNFLLRMLEKLAQRFKLVSLQVHNVFHRLLQSVKEKRKLSDAHRQERSRVVFPSFEKDTGEIINESSRADIRSIEKQNKSIQDEDGMVETIASHSEVSEYMVAENQNTTFSLDAPLRRQSRGEVTQVSSPIEDVPFTRPMVSDRAARPEKSKRRVFTRSVEEEMIVRIATNPKDYTAYEALGDFYMDKGAIQDAKECYKQVLKLSPVQRMVKVKIRRLERLLSQK